MSSERSLGARSSPRGGADRGGLGGSPEKKGLPWGRGWGGAEAGGVHREGKAARSLSRAAGSGSPLKRLLTFRMASRGEKGTLYSSVRFPYHIELESNGRGFHTMVEIILQYTGA